MTQDRDEYYMGLALKLAARGKGRTSPNPMVGAVIVKRRQVIGKGYHRRAGSDHAEPMALKAAGAKARGADLYVTLEPCAHFGRTGPCTKGIIAAGIRRVVVGMKDPNPLVNGKGIRALRRAGLEVVTGVLEEKCRTLNEAFLCAISQKRPHVTFKTAITLDGRVAARTGDSRWVTGEAARREGHRLRNTRDAIIVGVGTVLLDDPQLTCRGIRGGKDPVRVVVDSRLRTPPEAKIIQATADSPSPTWIFCTPRPSKRKALALEEAGARVFRVDTQARQVELKAMLKTLMDHSLISLLLEGGPTLAGTFWREGLIDRVIAFLAPKVIGDPQAMPMIRGQPALTMAEATSLSDVQIARLGPDIMVSGKIPCQERHGR